MAAILLRWNPDKWNWNGLYASVVTEVQSSGGYLQRWPLDAGTDYPAGTEVWLLVQGGGPNQRGLIGHGVTVGKPRATDVDIHFDLLLPQGDQVRTDELLARIPNADWNAASSSSELIPSDIEATVRALWVEHVLDRASRDTDTLDPVPGSYPERALMRISVNRYERTPEARAVAVAHHGSNCHACGFDFEITYGPQGAGFIHVHHSVPASRLGSDYEIDPVTDLVPLCPSCHYMAHRRIPDPYTVAELRAMIAAAGHLPGAVITPEQEQAQDAARRITETGSVTGGGGGLG